MYCNVTCMVSQISYGGSIDNMEQTINCFTEVVFNVAVWYTCQAVKWLADISYPVCLKQNIFGFLPGPVEVGAPVMTIGAADFPGGGMRNGLVHPLAGPAMLTWEVKCIQHIPKWQQILYSFVFTTIGPKWLFSTWNFVWIQHWEYHGTQLHYPPDRHLSSG